MALFSDIIGQEHIKEHLQGAIVSGMISHAYIIQGEEGMGKSMIAKTFATGLLCERGDAEPCLTCHACKQNLSDNHPDVRVLETENPALIKVDEIRQQIVNDVAIKPYSADYKVYIIPEAERMNPAAQNALLKTLEEPPEYTVIILLCSNASILLDTIISRCVLIDIRPLKDEQVKDYLMKKRHIPDYKASIMAAFARGNIGRAELLCGDNQFDEIRNLSSEVLKGIATSDATRISEYVSDILALESAPEEFFEYLTLWYRDVLIYKALGNAKQLLFKEDVRLISEMSKNTDYEGIERIIKEISASKSRLRVNVNKELTIELLLITISKSLNK